MADGIIMRDASAAMPASSIDISPALLSPVSSIPDCNNAVNGNVGGSERKNNTSNTAVMAKKFKGEKINCGDLRKYLYGFEIYRQASMLRKGREVHKIYVDVHKGVNFLDDRFNLTEFGRMVLDNGSVRAGRARNVRQIVVARETLYCSGTGGCKRACGGYGSCVSGCDKVKVRGHKCSFRVKLTMRLGFVDSWFVEILGSHNCYLANNTPSDLTSMMSDYDFKGSDGEDSSSLRSSPLSDSSLLTTPSSSQPQGMEAPLSFMSARSSPSSLNRFQTSTAFPPSLPSYPLNIPVFPESFVLNMARNAAALSNNNNNNSSSNENLGMTKNPLKPILPLSFPGLKRESIGSSEINVPEIMNAFLPPGLIPRFGAFPPFNLSSPVINNGHLHPRHPNLNSFFNQNNSMDTSSDPIDLTKPRVSMKVEQGTTCTDEEKGKVHDLSITLSSASKNSPVLSKNSNDTISSPVNALHLNGFHNLPRISEHNPPPPSHKEVINDNNMSNIGIFNIPHALSSTSHPSAFRCTAVPPATSSSSFPLGNKISPVPTPALSSLQLFNPSLSMPVSSPALAGKLCEKARKAICRRLDNHFLGSEAANFSNVKLDDQTKFSSEMKSFDIKREKEEDGRNGGHVNVSMSSSLDANAPGDCANSECDIEAEMDKDLINRVHQLESHVTQLRNVILKKEGGKGETGKKNKSQKQFDFNKYNTRHVALKIAYLGWDYHGFVVQEDSERTIEAAVFDALVKTRLLENRETSNYHRCGRTDKGVSSSGQVISLDLRTNLLEGVGVKVKEGGTASTRQGDTGTEIRYVHILNKVLPPEIRALAWAPVPVDFSARFSCKKRTYKYFFPKGDLDINIMNKAAHKLVGEHDFRNLCKMDVGNGVVNFIRKIISADVSVSPEGSLGYPMCELTVVGQAFLWHQIRCIVAVLFLIAQGKEEISVIDELLDVEKTPKKPQYPMASELPLNLYDCNFGEGLEWIYEADWHEDNIRHLQQMWAGHAVRATMIRRMLDELEVAKVETESDIAPWNELSAPLLQQSAWLIPGNKARVYTPLLKRQTCESLEERLEHFAKRRKLAPPSEKMEEAEAATLSSSQSQGDLTT